MPSLLVDVSEGKVEPLGVSRDGRPRIDPLREVLPERCMPGRDQDVISKLRPLPLEFELELFEPERMVDAWPSSMANPFAEKA
jgi:hypothetical protein